MSIVLSLFIHIMLYQCMNISMQILSKHIPFHLISWTYHLPCTVFGLTSYVLLLDIPCYILALSPIYCSWTYPVLYMPYPLYIVTGHTLRYTCFIPLYIAPGHTLLYTCLSHVTVYGCLVLIITYIILSKTKTIYCLWIPHPTNLHVWIQDVNLDALYLPYPPIYCSWTYPVLYLAYPPIYCSLIYPALYLLYPLYLTPGHTLLNTSLIPYILLLDIPYSKLALSLYILLLNISCSIMPYPRYIALGVVTVWSKVLIPVPWPLMVWSTLALGT